MLLFSYVLARDLTVVFFNLSWSVVDAVVVGVVNSLFNVDGEDDEDEDGDVLLICLAPVINSGGDDDDDDDDDDDELLDDNELNDDIKPLSVKTTACLVATWVSFTTISGLLIWCCAIICCFLGWDRNELDRFKRAGISISFKYDRVDELLLNFEVGWWKLTSVNFDSDCWLLLVAFSLDE